eukprot:TRINITY_DN1624_c0_g1_i9.p1 TRINITY_DN1624_c0_g1~~TRINITY_DN1624_c0_g1_i9.p1  ORF type:complete len:199 (-),score=35.41 TRINITY_DN1624_c0_g1_i9:128-724(-)
MAEQPVYKIMLLGNAGVGKSSLVHRFADNTFNGTYTATIGIDFKTRAVELDGQRIKLQIWDTAGQERYRNITAAYYRGADGVVLVYDIADEKSFQDVRCWMANIQMNSAENVPVVLLGNKCDLEDTRVVTAVLGKQVADEFQIPHFEASAKSAENVDDAFLAVIRTVMRRQCPLPPPRTSPQQYCETPPPARTGCCGT